MAGIEDVFLRAGPLAKNQHGLLDQQPQGLAQELYVHHFERVIPLGRGQAGRERQEGWACVWVQTYLVIVVWSVLLGTAPTTVSTFWPSLKSIRVGMLRMPYWLATLGFSSVLSLNTLI